MELTDLRDVNCEVLDKSKWDKIRDDIERFVPEGYRRDEAVQRINAAKNSEKNLKFVVWIKKK